jgi:hypothetical protein
MVSPGKSRSSGDRIAGSMAESVSREVSGAPGLRARADDLAENAHVRIHGDRAQGWQQKVATDEDNEL